MTAAVETEIAERDFAAEMRAIIDETTSNGPYSAAIAATQIVAKLRATDAGLLAGWLDAQAEQFVRMAIGHRDSSLRSVKAKAAMSEAFHDAAEEHVAGNSAPLRRFLEMPYVIEDGTRKPLAHLTKDDLLYVAGTYEARAKENAMRGAFMNALARKIRKGQTVADHFTEEQVANMWSSLAA